MHIFSTKARITALVLFSFPQYHKGKKKLAPKLQCLKDSLSDGNRLEIER